MDALWHRGETRQHPMDVRKAADHATDDIRKT
jgi:hypothetical protein